MLLIQKKKKKTRTLNIIFLKGLGLLIIKKKYARTSKPKNKMTQKYKIRLMGFGIAKENPFQKKIKIYQLGLVMVKLN